jgi:hypothetical protein
MSHAIYVAPYSYLPSVSVPLFMHAAPTVPHPQVLAASTAATYGAMEMQRLFSESAAALEMERRARELADGMRASKDSFVAVSVQAVASAVDQAKAARTAGLRKARALVLASRESAAHAAEVARTKDERSSELATASLKAAIEARESGDEAAQLQMLAEAEAAREHNLVEGAARSQAILTQRESTHKIAAARIDEAELAVRSAGSVARGIETEAEAERRRGFEASERGRAVAAQAAAEDAVRIHEKMSVEEKAKQRLVIARHAASQAQLDVAIATEREAKRKATIEGLRMAIEARRISFSALKLATRAREACELQAEALERTAITCEGRVAQLDERKRMALSSPSSPRPPATASKARPEVGEPSVKAVASTVGPVVGPESRGTASSPKLTATDPLMADAAPTRPAAEPPPAKLPVPVAGLAAPKPKPAATRFETAQARAAVASISNTEVKLGVARRAAARAREVAAKAQGAVEEAKARELAKEKEAQEATDKVLLMQKEAADLRRRSGSSTSTAERGPGLGGVITRASADASSTNSTAASVAALASDKTPSPWLFAPEQKRQAPLKVISSRAAADEKKFHAERAAEAAKRAAAERVAVERAVERRSREAQAALLRTGAAHAARAALLEAKVSAARESAARAHTEALAKIEAAKHLDEASAAQRKLVAAEWRAAEEAAASHALAVEKAASAARGAAARRAVAERAEELARAAHLEALAASEHAIALAEAVVAAEADEARLQGEDAEASHQGAMQVLAARRAATAQATSLIEQAESAHAASARKSSAAATAAAAVARSVASTSERPLSWFGTTAPAPFTGGTAVSMASVR